MYASYRPYDVIDRLTELVVPMQSDEEWATDLFVYWPAPAPPPVFAASRVILCANGRLFVVPESYPYYGCPGDSEKQLQQKKTPTSPPPDSVAADSVRRRLPEARPAHPRPELSKERDVAERRRALAGARPPSERERAVTSARTRSRDANDVHARRDVENRRVSTGRPARRTDERAERPTSTTRETSTNETTTSRGTESSTPRSEPRAPAEGSEQTRRDP
jgi:hypothetical protein